MVNLTCKEHLGMADEYLSKRCDVCDVAIEELFGINNSNLLNQLKLTTANFKLTIKKLIKASWYFNKIEMNWSV